VQLGVAFPADTQPPEVVQVSERALHDPALAAESGAVILAAAGDHGLHAPGADLAAVLVVVIAAIGQHAIGALAWPSSFAADRADTVQQGQQLGDVVALPTGQRDR